MYGSEKVKLVWFQFLAMTVYHIYIYILHTEIYHANRCCDIWKREKTQALK